MKFIHRLSHSFHQTVRFICLGLKAGSHGRSFYSHQEKEKFRSEQLTRSKRFNIPLPL